MTWTGFFTRQSGDFFLATQPYLDISRIVFGGPLSDPPRVLEDGPDRVVFRATTWIGEVHFEGTGLTLDQGAPLPGGGTFPKFTAGTITKITIFYNEELERLTQLPSSHPDRDEAIQSVQNVENLRFNGVIFVDNMSAAAFATAVEQSFVARNDQPLQNFLGSFSHIYTGTDGANLLQGQSGPDYLEGRGSVTFEPDNLIGLAGDDTLVGGPVGTTAYFGGAGNDLYIAGAGTDSISDDGPLTEFDTVSYINSTAGVTVDLYETNGNSSAGDARGDVLGGVEGVIGSNFDDLFDGKSDVVFNGLADDSIFGADGNDIVQTNAGSDRIAGGPGDDSIDGGADSGLGLTPEIDVAVYAADPADVHFYPGSGGFFFIATPGGGIDTLFQIEAISMNGTVRPVSAFSPSSMPIFFGQETGDNFTGGDGPGFLFGRTGNDRLDGAGGSDSVEGGAGDDTVSGGTGNDLVFGNGGDDQVSGGDGDDTVSGGTGRDTVSGGPGNDLILGGTAGDSLDGGTGTDTLDLRGLGAIGLDDAGGSSRTGTATIGQTGETFAYANVETILIDRPLFVPGDEPDPVDEPDDPGPKPGGDGIVEGTGGAERIDKRYKGDPEGDRIDAKDAVAAGAGPNDDRVEAGGGSDTVKSGKGADLVIGGNGADTVSGGSGDDTLNGGKGNDALKGQGGGDRLLGGGGKDKANGGGGDDLLDGGGGGDDLAGANGDDTLRGKAGNDVLNGGKGDDLLDGGGGRDRFDFRRGDGEDTIEGFEIGRDVIDFAGASGMGDLDFTREGSNVRIEYLNVDVIVADVRLNQIRDADNFDF